MVTVGINASGQVLEPGDTVTILGVQTSTLDTAPALWQVAPAGEGMSVVGVVNGRANLDTTDDGQSLVPHDGPARPGDYVTIVTHGATRVKVNTASSPIQPGMRLTAGKGGQARALETVAVEGVTVSEGAPCLGIVLGAAEENGFAWVLVNPQ
jgi:hypothetical protein